ncbi:SLAC1 anion channel family protein [Blastochloris sulfoviridis]|uniref:C4-dicarboxylate ABC transporter n=1 Tax=Blastochloris sulfoviridis TaxID=50712 RepID=A0A5M6I501_9HYPH|nr:SLAC1 anion channel family protein [Blastochloris sulfoviridis]KAA5602879.1 C4-dicarboxylate ABC transporter [Blastochloris sulfoviridis]
MVHLVKLEQAMSQLQAVETFEKPAQFHTPPAREEGALAHMPVGLFGMVMGLAGTTLASQAAARALGGGLAVTAQWIALTAAGITLAVGSFIFLAYFIKLLRYPHAVVAEWHHHVRINFFPAASIALALVATMLLPHAPGVARVVWIIAAIGHAIGFVGVVSHWMGPRTIPVATLNPAWFIPAVGNVVMPIAGVDLGYLSVSWLFFGTGLMFWLVLLPMVIHRFVFEAPLPPKLVPTLAILIAPPAVAFIAYVKLTGGLDAGAQVLFGATIAFALLVVAAAGRIAKAPFGVPFWALSFPTAGLTIATLTYGAKAGIPGVTFAGLGLWAFLLVLIVVLLVRTLVAQAQGRICVPE